MCNMRLKKGFKKIKYHYLTLKHYRPYIKTHGDQEKKK